MITNIYLFKKIFKKIFKINSSVKILSQFHKIYHTYQILQEEFYLSLQKEAHKALITPRTSDEPT